MTVYVLVLVLIKGYAITPLAYVFKSENRCLVAASKMHEKLDDDFDKVSARCEKRKVN